MPKLKVVEGPEAGREFELSGATATIGRSPGCEIRLDDGKTSRQHAEVLNEDGKLVLRDLGSRNGTYIAGKKISEVVLEHDLKVAIGNNVLVFEAERETDEQGNLMEPILATRKGQELDITKIAIKGYDIIEVVGKGGMGYVCKARQVSMDRLVAIKILNEKFADNPAFVARFISEARAAGKLNHPNVIQVHDVGQYNNIYFFSMEYLEGNTVREILKNKKHIAPVEAIRVTMEIAKALDYAHRLGIIHQDIKPDNIMVDKNGQVKLADLGISKVYEENAAELNEVMGSPHFMSPEQALGKPVDGRSDLYSLGVSLFQMLAGDTPFSGVSIQEILKKHVNEPVPNVRDFNSQVPGKVASVI